MNPDEIQPAPPDVPPAEAAIEPAAPVAVPREPFWGYEDMLIFLLLAIPAVLISIVLSVVVMFVMPAAKDTSPETIQAYRLIPLQFVFYGLWFSALAVLFRLRYQAPFWRSLGWTLPAKWIGPSLAYGLALAIAVTVAGVVLRTPQVDTPMRKLMQDPAIFAALVIFGTTLGPICEELIFRGFLFPLFRRTFGVLGAILLTSLPFALLHGPQYSWTWQYVLLLTLASCTFGWHRFRTGSTAAAALMHAAYNGVFFGLFAIQKRSLGF